MLTIALIAMCVGQPSQRTSELAEDPGVSAEEAVKAVEELCGHRVDLVRPPNLVRPTPRGGPNVLAWMPPDYESTRYIVTVRVADEQDTYDIDAVDGHLVCLTRQSVKPDVDAEPVIDVAKAEAIAREFVKRHHPDAEANDFPLVYSRLSNACYALNFTKMVGRPERAVPVGASVDISATDGQVTLYRCRNNPPKGPLLAPRVSGEKAIAAIRDRLGIEAYETVRATLEQWDDQLVWRLGFQYAAANEAPAIGAAVGAYGVVDAISGGILDAVESRVKEDIGPPIPAATAAKASGSPTALQGPEARATALEQVVAVQQDADIEVGWIAAGAAAVVLATCGGVLWVRRRARDREGLREPT